MISKETKKIPEDPKRVKNKVKLITEERAAAVGAKGRAIAGGTLMPVKGIYRDTRQVRLLATIAPV